MSVNPRRQAAEPTALKTAGIALGMSVAITGLLTFLANEFFAPRFVLTIHTLIRQEIEREISRHERGTHASAVPRVEFDLILQQLQGVATKSGTQTVLRRIQELEYRIVELEYRIVELETIEPKSPAPKKPPVIRENR